MAPSKITLFDDSDTNYSSKWYCFLLTVKEKHPDSITSRIEQQIFGL